MGRGRSRRSTTRSSTSRRRPRPAVFESRDTKRELDALEQALGALATQGTTSTPGARRRRLGAIHRRLMAATAVDITARTATRRALVPAPHPDDETLACGATILRKTDAGTEVMVVVASDGEGGGVTEEVAVDGLDHPRRAECLEACHRLGVDEQHVRFLGFADTKLARHEPELAAAIAEIVTEFRPLEIFVPSGIDQHIDHRALAACRGQPARRCVARCRCARVRGVDVESLCMDAAGSQPSSTTTRIGHAGVSWTLTTRARRVTTRGVLARKRHALEAHASQIAILDPEFVAQFLEDDELFFPFHSPYRP